MTPNLWTPQSAPPAMPVVEESRTDQIMPYHKRGGDESCNRLTKFVSSKDHRLFALVNQKLQRYEVWRNNESGSQCMVFRLSGPNGEYVSPDEFMQNALARLRQMESESGSALIARVEAENEKLKRDAQKQETEAAIDAAVYMQKRIAAEDEGRAVRHSDADAKKGYESRWV